MCSDDDDAAEGGLVDKKGGYGNEPSIEVRSLPDVEPFSPSTRVDSTPREAPPAPTVGDRFADNSREPTPFSHRLASAVLPGVEPKRSRMGEPELDFSSGRAISEVIGGALMGPGWGTIAGMAYDKAVDPSMAVNPGPQGIEVGYAPGMEPPEAPATTVAGDSDGREPIEVAQTPPALQSSPAPTPQQVAAALQAQNPGYTRPGGIDFGRYSEDQLRAIFG